MIKKVVLALACFSFLLTSCSKRYEFDNVNGVYADGEFLLPLVKASYTFDSLVDRLQLDTMMTFDESGGIHYMLNYDLENVVDGKKIMFFKDIDVNNHFSIPNPCQYVLPEPIDTTLIFTQTVTLSSDYISVLMAEICSGSFDFEISSNIPELSRIIIRSSEIKDANGTDMCLVYNPSSGHAGLDLAGFLYETETENTVNINYEVSFTAYDFTAPELNFDVMLHVTDLHVSRMRGRIMNYSLRHVFDTVFDLFPKKVEGVASVCDMHVRLMERNDFGMDARLYIDTVLVSGDGVPSYTVFDPLTVPVLESHEFVEVLDKKVHGALNMVSDNVYASGLFVLNPEESLDIVNVNDTSAIDVKIAVDLPFAFNVQKVSYTDTLEVKTSDFDYPEIIQEIDVDLEFLTDLPFNLGVNVYMYDSQHQIITDTLTSNARIQGSFDGTKKASTIVAKVTEDRVNNVLNSDGIILSFTLNTDAHDVVLNLKQCVEFTSKAYVRYNGNVDFNKE